MLLWLVTTVALIAIALACDHGGSQDTCTRSWATFCTSAIRTQFGPGHSLNIARVREHYLGGAGADGCFHRPPGRCDPDRRPVSARSRDPGAPRPSGPVILPQQLLSRHT